MITIYLGDVTEQVRICAQTQDTAARLLMHEDCINIPPGTYYTSLGDLLTLRTLMRVLNQANHLIYVPPDQWSDEKDGHSDMRQWTEFALRVVCNRIKMTSDRSLTKHALGLTLADDRKSDSNQLWVVGCSITAGVGIQPHERYGKILADKFGLPVSFIAHRGSSIEWARDQILLSDIRAGDIVVWGLTIWNRLVYYDHDRTWHVNTNTFKKYPDLERLVEVDRLYEPNLLYKSILACYQVNNFCRRIGAKLYLAGLLTDDQILPFLMPLSNFRQLLGTFGMDADSMFLDLGDDGMHPGPVTHQWYAQMLYDQIQSASDQQISVQVPCD